jgi:hypothetical protein
MQDQTDPLPEDRRREIFAALVVAQDQGVPVARSRAQVADRFGLTREAVAAIEREGLDNDWPPL